MRKNPLLMTDGYKTSHHTMYPEGTKLVYSNFTLRNVKYMVYTVKKYLRLFLQSCSSNKC